MVTCVLKEEPKFTLEKKKQISVGSIPLKLCVAVIASQKCILAASNHSFILHYDKGKIMYSSFSQKVLV